MAQSDRHSVRAERLRSDLLGGVGAVVLLVGRLRQEVVRDGGRHGGDHRGAALAVGDSNKHVYIHSRGAVVDGDDLLRFLRGSIRLKLDRDAVARTVGRRHVANTVVQLVRVQRHGNVLSRGAQRTRHDLAAEPRALSLRRRRAARERLQVVPRLVESVAHVILAELERRLDLLPRGAHRAELPLLAAEPLLIQEHLATVVNAAGTTHNILRALPVHEHHLGVNHRVVGSRHPGRRLVENVRLQELGIRRQKRHVHAHSSDGIVALYPPRRIRLILLHQRQIGVGESAQTIF